MQSPPRPRRPRWLLVVLLIGLAVGGYVAFRTIRDNNNYDAGLAAYQQGDCETALAAWRQINPSDSWLSSQQVVSDLSSKRSWCSNFQRARDLAADLPGDALLIYRGLVNEAEGPLADALQRELTTLYRERGAPALATSAQYCALVRQQPDLIVAEAGEDLLADLLLACVETYQTASAVGLGLCSRPAASLFNLTGNCSDEEMAVNRSLFVTEYLDLFRQRYPDDPRQQDVEAQIIAELDRQAELFGAGEIPQPQMIGTHDGDTARLQIQNDAFTLQPLRLAFGQDLFEVPACPACQEFTEAEQAECPAVGPIETIEVPAGAYRVLVTTLFGANITPFRGTWNLEAGVEYYSCFVLVRSE